MKPHHLKPIIKAQIITFFNQFRPGDILRTDDVVRAVKRRTGIKSIYPDTILRHLRSLRSEGKVCYTCENKQKRTIRVIAVGETHSR